MHEINPVTDSIPRVGFYQLAYCSVATRILSAQEIHNLVMHAQNYNARNGITGMLMIDNGLIIQWLEGLHGEVRGLWKRIQLDPRHHCVVQLLHRDYQEERLFPDWTMGRSTRAEMLAIVHNAREAANSPNLLPNPWAEAISTLCVLIDPHFAKGYSPIVQANSAPL